METTERKRMPMILDASLPKETPEGEPMVMVNHVAVGPLVHLRAFEEVGSKPDAIPPEFYSCHPDTWGAMPANLRSYFRLYD